MFMQFSEAVQITSLPLVFIPDNKAVVWSRLELGIRALWLQESRWLCLALWTCVPGSVDLCAWLSQDLSAPDLGLSCSVEWAELGHSCRDTNHHVLLPRT